LNLFQNPFHPDTGCKFMFPTEVFVDDEEEKEKGRTR
jgi:hypothetical protein